MNEQEGRWKQFFESNDENQQEYGMLESLKNSLNLMEQKSYGEDTMPYDSNDSSERPDNVKTSKSQDNYVENLTVTKRSSSTDQPLEREENSDKDEQGSQMISMLSELRGEFDRTSTPERLNREYVGAVEPPSWHGQAKWNEDGPTSPPYDEQYSQAKFPPAFEYGSHVESESMPPTENTTEEFSFPDTFSEVQAKNPGKPHFHSASEIAWFQHLGDEPREDTVDSNKGQEELLKEVNYIKHYKSSLCPSFTENGTCENIVMCSYAHGEEELNRFNEMKYNKAVMCKSISTSSYCPLADRCFFAHTKEEMLVRKHALAVIGYRTVMCQHLPNCAHGDFCHHAHSEEEMKEQRKYLSLGSDEPKSTILRTTSVPHSLVSQQHQQIETLTPSSRSYGRGMRRETTTPPYRDLPRVARRMSDPDENLFDTPHSAGTPAQQLLHFQSQAQTYIQYCSQIVSYTEMQARALIQNEESLRMENQTLRARQIELAHENAVLEKEVAHLKQSNNDLERDRATRLHLESTLGIPKNAPEVETLLSEIRSLGKSNRDLVGRSAMQEHEYGKLQKQVDVMRQLMQAHGIRSPTS